MIADILFEAFSRRYEPPCWIIESLQRHGSFEVRDALNAALEAVSLDEILFLDRYARMQGEILFPKEDYEMQARLFIVGREISRLIEMKRLELAKLGVAAPLYEHPALRGVLVDDEGLVSLAEFKIDGDALCRNGFAFFVLHPVPGSNANYWLLDEIQRFKIVDSIRVRLDPVLYGQENKLRGYFYKALVYGRDLNWKRIQNLKEIEHGRWTPGQLSRDYFFTDYAWIPHAQEVDFQCEELPVEKDIEIRGSRYLHAIYDKNHNEIKHLDGAIRIMTPSEFAIRTQQHVRNAGKVGIRIKTFRTDQPIPPATLGAIAQRFFFWNNDVAKYFGAPVQPDL